MQSFDIKKLNWINSQHIRKLTPDAFFELAKPFMVKAGYMTGDESGEKLDWLKRVVATAQTQVTTVPGAGKGCPYFTDDSTSK